jgi:hypothetical protein
LIVYLVRVGVQVRIETSPPKHPTNTCATGRGSACRPTTPRRAAGRVR